jgi:hypothetical protein
VLGARQGLKIVFSIFESLNGGFRPPFAETMERKMRECSGLDCLVIAFSSASFQRLWGAFIGEANRLKCLKRRLRLAFGIVPLGFAGYSLANAFR